MERHPNEAIVDELHSLAELAGKSSHKQIAYNAAARSLHASDHAVCEIVKSGSPRPKISFVGPKIWKIIEEWCTTGITSMRLELEEIHNSRAVFTSILGVGEKDAEDYVASGLRTIDDLRRAVADGHIKLSRVQTLGLTYYDDLLRRIPRAEVASILATVSGHIAAAFEASPPPLAVGSYRRELPTSGDVDILVGYSGNGRPTDALAAVLAKVKNTHVVSSGMTRITFLTKGWVYMRQVDVLIIPPEEWGAALLYFTGSKDFNESMRRYAKVRGFRLNQRGLYHDKKLVAQTTEEDIFRALGLEYVPPAGRLGASHWELRSRI